MKPAKPRILFVEDNEDTRLVLAIILERSGYEAVPAGTWAQGWELAQCERFDLSLLDNRLPDGQGVDLCRKIRELAPQPPILFISAAAYEADKQETLAAGAQGYLTKPTGIEELGQTIAQLLHQGNRKALSSHQA